MESEPDQAFRAFLLYCQLAPEDRSLFAVAKTIRRSRRTVENYRRKWQWQIRVLERDEEQRSPHLYTLTQQPDGTVTQQPNDTTTQQPDDTINQQSTEAIEVPAAELPAELPVVRSIKSQTSIDRQAEQFNQLREMRVLGLAIFAAAASAGTVPPSLALKAVIDSMKMEMYLERASGEGEESDDLRSPLGSLSRLSADQLAALREIRNAALDTA